MLYNIHYLWFFLSQSNQLTKYLAHPKIQRQKPNLLMFDTLDDFHLLLSTQLTADLTPEWSSGSIFHPLSHCCFWSTVSKCNTHFKHNFLVDECSCKIVNTLPSDMFNSSAISCNYKLQSAKMSFLVFFRTGRIWTTRAFSIICVCMTTFKVSIPPLKHCSWWGRIWITLIKPLLCSNSIFFHQKIMLYQHTKFRFFHCFENLQE